MKNLIYQYYDGKDLSGTRASVKSMKDYAKKIGAEHLFEQDPKWLIKQNRNLGKFTPHYGQFKVVYDEYFEQYDNILFLDTDIFAVDGLVENIFDTPVKHIGLCEEKLQPDMRKKYTVGRINSVSDERFGTLIKNIYGKELPRRKDGLMKVYNSGVVLYTKEGREYCRKNFVKFETFYQLVVSAGIDSFYASDQGYLHAMLEVANLEWTALDSGWNSYVHYLPETSGPRRPVIDTRTENTKFVHIQLRGADDYNSDKLWKIINLKETEWEIYQ